MKLLFSAGRAKFLVPREADSRLEEQEERSNSFRRVLSTIAYLLTEVPLGD